MNPITMLARTRVSVLLLAMFFGASLARPALAAEDHEIDRTVWQPFLRAFAENDAAAFNALHSKDLVRADRDQGRVMDLAEYSRFNEDSFQQAREYGWKRVLELRFTERLRRGDLAYEVGIYRTRITIGTETRTYLGRFHVVLRNEDGAWKILVDSDSSEGGTVGEKDFADAKLEIAR